jgi:hypothetical protein
MRKHYFALLLFCGIILTSCDNKTASLQFEKDVMYEIYPALMDSVWVKAVLTYVPPPPPGVRESEYKLNKEKESDKRFNTELAEFKKKKIAVDLVFFDKAVVRDNAKELQEHFKDAVISEKSISDTLEYKFDRKQLDAYKVFHLQYITKTPKGNERQLYDNCCYSIRGTIVLSRIEFDAEKKYGLLTAGIECGSLCGYGYRIFIKKIKEKWIIDKIEKAWIA